MYANYVQGTNPFQLGGPPLWFQRQLWEFDPTLVIVASKQGFFYRLAQRRQLQLNEQVVNSILHEQADTAMLASHGLVPITTIVSTVNWSSPVFFQELRKRAPWRMGGAKVYEENLLAEERAKDIQQAVQQDEDNTYRSKDGWHYYNKLIGTRSHAFKLKTTQPKTENVAPAIHIPGETKTPYRPLITTSWGGKG